MPFFLLTFELKFNKKKIIKIKSYALFLLKDTRQFKLEIKLSKNTCILNSKDKHVLLPANQTDFHLQSFSENYITWWPYKL